MAASQVERTLSEVAISSYSSGIPKFASQETAGNHVRWENEATANRIAFVEVLTNENAAPVPSH
jgi:hypothetical protein